jgi:hypothetical protein
MSLIGRIQHELETDDDDQSDRLIDLYESADEKGKALLDAAFTCLCGYELRTLINWNEEV